MAEENGVAHQRPCVLDGFGFCVLKARKLSSLQVSSEAISGNDIEIVSGHRATIEFDENIPPCALAASSDAPLEAKGGRSFVKNGRRAGFGRSYISRVLG